MGISNRKDLSFVGGLVLAVLAAAAMLGVKACSKLEYPGEWVGVEGAQFNNIAATLGQNRISGCGEFWYKLESGKDRGEAVVYCLKRSPHRWRLLTVFYRTGKVNEGAEYSGPPPEIPH